MLATEWLPLCGATFVLGLRHGLDTDHLAAIDGLTRYNSESSPCVAKWCGTLFALGHGTVVLLVAGLVGSATLAFRIPGWLEDVGTWISIGLLLALGLLNLHSVLRTPSDEVARLSGLRGTLLLRLTRTCSPLSIVAVGSLFAISFDTLSQAVLFSTTAARVGGALGAIALAGAFTAGMALIDGLNGGWVAGLMRAGDRRARIASRAMGWFVAILSFAVATLGAIRYFNRSVDAVVGTHETFIGIALITCAVGAIVVIGRSRKNREPPTTVAEAVRGFELAAGQRRAAGHGGSRFDVGAGADRAH